MRSAAGDPMKSAAGDPNLEHLFHPQVKFEDGNFTMVREAGGDSIEIRCAFAVTLACVLVEFSKAASAAEIYEMYKAWPLAHAKKERQKAGAPTGSRWRRPQTHAVARTPSLAAHHWQPLTPPADLRRRRTVIKGSVL